MFKNTFLVTICLILSAVLGFIAQIVYASVFGASAEMDIYFKILSVPAVVMGMSGTIFSSVLIPTFAKFKSHQSERDRFAESIWVIILVFGFLFILFGSLFSVVNIDKFVPEDSPILRKFGAQVAIMIWIGSGFAIMSGYLSAILNYKKLFFIVAWTSLLPVLFMIVVVLLFHHELGVRGISLGFCIASIVQFIILYKSSRIYLNVAAFKLQRIAFKKLLLRQSSLVTLSLLPFTILVPIGFFWASKLEVGSVSYLGYSQSFAGFLSVTVSMGISIVAFPEMAEKFANDDGESALYIFEKRLRYVLIISMFAAGALIALRLPILTLFYERGSFDAKSVSNLSNVLPWYLVAAVFTGCLNLIRTLFYSRAEFKDIAKLGVMMPIVFFVFAGVLKEKYSFVGIGIANALTFASLFFLTVHLAKNEELEFLTSDFLHFIFKNLIVVVLAGLFVNICLPFALDFTSPLISIFVCLFLFAVVHILASKLVFRIREVDEISLVILHQLKLSGKT